MDTALAESIQGESRRYAVRTSTIDPAIPSPCVKCLNPQAETKRKLSFRRSDGTVERVSVVYWPYCQGCAEGLKPFDRQQKLMTFFGGLQTLLIFYLLGGAVALYDIWWPSIWVLLGLIVAFIYYARKARALWGLEWARIEDVFKGGLGAEYSFRNQHYAELFAEANAAPKEPETTS